MKRLMVFGLLTLFLMSCNKNKGDGTVRLTVVNKDGVPIQNCNVKLTYPESAEAEWGVDYFLAQTDIEGQVEFKLGVNAYFDVYVWKGLWEGCDFIEFVPGEENEKDIVIYSPTTPFNGCF